MGSAKSKTRKCHSNQITLYTLVTGDDDHLLHLILSFMGNRDLYTSFMTTCKRFHRVAQQYLDPIVNGNRPIRYACQKGYSRSVQSLLQDPRVDPSE